MIRETLAILGDSARLFVSLLSSAVMYESFPAVARFRRTTSPTP